jgi:hypothetical protein
MTQEDKVLRLHKVIKKFSFWNLCNLIDLEKRKKFMIFDL